MVDISIIVPIYNSSKYLQRCLNSIINQTFKNFEIIAIDDGSSDNSLDILKQLQQQDKRINIYACKHQGVSATRNYGIKLAKSKIISFVDSDDTIKPDMLEQMYLKMLSSVDIDIVFTRTNYINTDGEVYKTSNVLAENKSNYLSNMISGKIASSLPAGIYKKELFIKNKILCPVGKYFEDVTIMYRLVYKAKDIMIIQKPMYNYYNNQKSITNSLSKKHLQDLFWCINDLEGFLTKHDLWVKYSSEYIEKIMSTINFVYYKISQNNFSDNTIDEILQNTWTIIKQNNYLEKILFSKKILFYFNAVKNFKYSINQKENIEKYFTPTNREKYFLEKAVSCEAGLFVYALENLRKKGIKEIYLYGGGVVCKKMIPIIESMSITILNIIDKSATNNTTLDGYTLINLDRFEDNCHDKVVFITSEAFAYEITLYLENLNTNIDIINFYQDIESER